VISASPSWFNSSKKASFCWLFYKQK